MIPGSANPLLLKSAAAAGAYQVSRSLRFNSSDSGFCSRTFSSTGNRTSWTWSGWVKRSNLVSSSRQVLFGGYGANNDTDWFEFGFGYVSEPNDSFYWTTASTLSSSAAVFRDLSAWYHILVSYNGTNIIVYINNTTVLTSSKSGNLGINGAWLHTLGRSPLSGIRYFNGYLADIHFIDGQALTPSSFTEVSATTGQLIPLAYSGTFGTNGFWLKFSDNSAATAATLGKDYSGNSNNWTPNNFSVVAGGALQVTFPASNSPTSVDYLVVGGGGGGGASSGGGGGAGGFLSGSALSVLAGTTYAVEVGAGGLGAAAGASPTAGRNGGTSRFSSIVALGGGGGGSRASSTAPTTGGSGGGGFGDLVGTSTGAAGTAGQGNAGGSGLNGSGYGSGGGGGAGAVGATATFNQSGTGGAGSSSSITGTSVTYAGGGGGGASANGAVAGGGGTGGGAAGGAYETNGNSASANTGGGGGAAGGTATTNYRAGGNGGSGIVVIRYANTFADLANIGAALTYTYSNSGGYKIYTFTASVSPADAAGNDSLVDTPTSFGTDTGVGGEVRGNYCTLNPLDNGSVTLSNGNLDGSATVAWKSVRGTVAFPLSGKWYYEVTPGGSALLGVGIAAANKNLTDQSTGTFVTYNEDGRFYKDGSINASGKATYTSGDVIGVAFNCDTNSVTFYKNNVSQGSVTPTTGASYFPFVQIYNSSYSANFGQRAFAYTAPSGFKALCDTNLPAPLVAKPNTVMDVALWTGNATARSIPLNFSPDFVWGKDRTGAGNHNIYDIVRGANIELRSNETMSDRTNTQGLTSFDSNGFSLGTGSDSDLNLNGRATVAWCWDAGTSTVSNTQGSITSQVRANVSAGFSVVGWTGNGSAANIGHGLGAEPHLIIQKFRGGASNWSVYTKPTGAGGRLKLNTTDSFSADGSFPTTPTSSLFYVHAGANDNGVSMIAYCFAPVVGYSSFGSYTGNGSTDGPFVYLGFKPRWIMIKPLYSYDGGGSTVASTAWYIYDSARGTYNGNGAILGANNSYSEENNATDIDFLSNGFKLRNVRAVNTSNGAIYAAFAENPFQYARAR